MGKASLLRHFLQSPYHKVQNAEFSKLPLVCCVVIPTFSTFVHHCAWETLEVSCKKSSYTTEPFGGFALTGILGMYLRGLQKYGERERTPAPCSSCWPIQSQLGMNKAGGSCHEISGHTHLPLILCPNLTGLKKQTRCP